MILDENLVAVHAYLCADGYVIKNPLSQKHKYYKIGFRNTNLILLKDFQEKFEKVFGIKPHLYVGQRCQKGSKYIYELLTREFGSFYSWEWKMLNLNDDRLLAIWLRAFFDCESWVFCKSHKNRHIGLDSVNEVGLKQVQKALLKFGIKTKWKINSNRTTKRIIIYGKENICKFSNNIGFLHPEKNKKLHDCINDYVNYIWNFPSENKSRKMFVLKLLKEKIRINKNRSLKIFSKEEINLIHLSSDLKRFFKVFSIVRCAINGQGIVYYELGIYRKGDISKLISLKVIPNVFK